MFTEWYAFMLHRRLKGGVIILGVVSYKSLCQEVQIRKCTNYRGVPIEGFHYLVNDLPSTASGPTSRSRGTCG